MHTKALQIHETLQFSNVKEKEVEKLKCLNTLKTLERNDLHIYEGEEINTFIHNGYITLIKSDSKAHFYKRFLF